MRTATRIVVALPFVALAAGTVVASATGAVQLQPDPCVITLAPSYVANPDNTLLTPVPDSAVACPGFTYDSQVTGINVPFQTTTGQSGPQLSSFTEARFDPVTNTIDSTNHLYLNGSVSGAFPLTFTDIALGYGFNVGNFYITNAGLNYRLTLGRPFTVTSQAATTPNCVLNLDPQYAYKWDQEGYFIVPDSAVQCDGFTFNSRDYSLSMSFDSKTIGAGSLQTNQRRVYTPATRSYTTVYELQLTSSGTGRFFTEHGHRENGMIAPIGSVGWTWGRFSQGSQVGTVTAMFNPQAGTQPPPPPVPLNLRESFAIKRLTTVTASGTPVAGGKLKVKIGADRNWNFQNGEAPTYRRQPVLPATPADHAQLSRDGKPIRRVTLSQYGNATITIPRRPGRHTYTVTMGATNENFAGVATFRG